MLCSREIKPFSGWVAVRATGLGLSSDGSIGMSAHQVGGEGATGRRLDLRPCRIVYKIMNLRLVLLWVLAVTIPVVRADEQREQMKKAIARSF